MKPKNTHISLSHQTKQISKQTDFFAAYAGNHRKQWMMMSFLAFAFAFIIVASIETPHGEQTSLLASIANLGQSSVDYGADLVLSHSGDTLTFTFGSDARAVDTIEGILLTDPSVALALRSTDQITFTELSPGMYRFVIMFGGRDIFAGASLVSLVIGNVSIDHMALTDTEFTSNGKRYSLTNIVE